jgi:hypothetical protein
MKQSSSRHLYRFLACLLFLAIWFLPSAIQAQTNTFPGTGNVGIGTLSPAYPLDVIGSARISGPLYLNGGTDQSMTATPNGNWDFLNGAGGGWYFRWIQNGATPMTLSTNNNLLLGTTTDAGYKLNVNGTALIQDNLTIGSTTVSQPLLLMNSSSSANLSMTTGGSTNSAFYIYANGGSNGSNYAQIGNSNVGLYFDTRSTIAPFRFISGVSTDWMDIFSSGNVGIGSNNSDPGYKLSVNGSLRAQTLTLPTGAALGMVLTSDANGNASWQAAGQSAAGWAFGGNTVGTVKDLGTVDNNDFPLITDNVERMRITARGNLLIGKSSQTNTGYILDINGIARANTVIVNTTGADFVFDSTYHLPSLASVEQYIRANHHLPGIVPAAQMKQEGVDLGDSHTRLLQKIEEMTLYIIEQDKRLAEQKKENDELRGMLSRQKNLLQEQKELILQVRAELDKRIPK